jgi:hypothetical protein
LQNVTQIVAIGENRLFTPASRSAARAPEFAELRLHVGAELVAEVLAEGVDPDPSDDIVEVARPSGADNPLASFISISLASVMYFRPAISVAPAAGSGNTIPRGVPSPGIPPLSRKSIGTPLASGCRLPN